MYVDQFGREHRYAPPAGWVQPSHETFSADEDWQRLVARGLEFEPYSGPSKLYGVRGDCMEPLLIAGQHMLKVRPVAPDEPLIDGGMYCIEWDDADEEIPYKTKMGIPLTERIVITKLLRFIAGEWWCQCKDSIARLEGVVVGMVVGVVALSAATAGCSPVQNPQELAHARMPACSGPFDANSANCGQVGLNAATVTYLATNNFSGLAASGTTGQNNTNISFTPGAGPAYDCIAIITVVVAVHQSAGAGTIKIMIGYDDTGGTSYTWSVPEVLVSATSASYTLQYQYAHSGLNTGSSRVALGWDSSSTANALTADGYETFSVEFIKR